LLLIAANPTVRIDDTLHIHAVWRGGVPVMGETSAP
jgi:hypothetical protein